MRRFSARCCGFFGCTHRHSSYRGVQDRAKYSPDTRTGSTTWSRRPSAASQFRERSEPPEPGLVGWTWIGLTGHLSSEPEGEEAVIRERTATDGGGGLDAGQNSLTTMHDGSRSSNNTGSHGGGIQLFGCTLTLGSGSRVSGNEGTTDVGGIDASSSTVTLQDGSIVGGTTPEDANKGNANSSGIFCSNGTLTLESGSRVIGNSATPGAGIGSSFSTVTVRSGARITGNTASTNGGGIQTFTGSATVEAGAPVCDNLPLNAQCAGTISGTCPAPGQVCPA